MCICSFSWFVKVSQNVAFHYPSLFWGVVLYELMCIDSSYMYCMELRKVVLGEVCVWETKKKLLCATTI